MRLTNEVYLVGGGFLGFGLSGHYDCHMYVIDGGAELALVDAGLGLPGDLDLILDNMRADGLESRRLRRLLLTHYHGDHIGGAREIWERFGVEVIAPAEAAEAIRNADEEITSLRAARALGGYPADYRLKPCPVHRELREGDAIAVGGLELTAWETPGHCRGHISYLLQGAQRRYLFGGDLIFWGGKISLINTHDASLADYAASIRKLMALSFDALLPGHLSISLREGKRHVEQAAEEFNRLGVPRNYI